MTSGRQKVDTSEVVTNEEYQSPFFYCQSESYGISGKKFVSHSQIILKAAVKHIVPQQPNKSKAPAGQ